MQLCLTGDDGRGLKLLAVILFRNDSQLTLPKACSLPSLVMEMNRALDSVKH